MTARAELSGGQSARRRGDVHRPAIVVQWGDVSSGPAAVVAAARDVAELVLGHRQRVDDGDQPLTARVDDSGPQIRQAVAPIGYREASERFAGVQWQAVDGGTLLLVTESGVVLKRKSRRSERARHIVADVDAISPTRRRPMRINRRPGAGGLQRVPAGDDVDPTEELDSFGETIWEAVGEGAWLGVMDLDAEGNTAIFARLSGDDHGERFVDQLQPCLALARQHPDVLRPRVAIFARNMTGTDQREVRHHRAGPPPPGVLERDDILRLDEYIAAGWLEHAVWRDPTRMARHTLPGEMIIATLQRENIGTWIAYYGKKVDWAEDGDRLRSDLHFSAKDRDNIVRKLQTAQINKGPLAGNGHLGPTPLGVVRDKRTRRRYEDPEQMRWINLAFELADTAAYQDQRGLSVRKLAAELAELGFPISAERLRRILRDPLYATGENTTTLRGVTIEQNPIEFENPVPIDRWQRVQEALDMRVGKEDNTPLGEFLFNQVETLHKQCMDERNSRNLPPRIKGWVRRRNGNLSETRTLKHAYFTPDHCKAPNGHNGGAFSWERDIYEAVVVEELRRLAQHPEVVRQLAAATRHTVSAADVRLSEEQRCQIEKEIEQLELERDEATDRWVTSGIDGGRQASRLRGFADYQRFIESYERQIKQRRRRLERDASVAVSSSAPDPRHDERLNAFLEIMTIETPDDLYLKSLRGRLFQRIISRIIIDDEGDGPVTITIEGELVPTDSPLEQGNPVLAAADLLDAYNDRKRGRTPRAEAVVEEVAAVETALSDRAEWAVSTLYTRLSSMPSNKAVDAARGELLDATSWRTRMKHSRLHGIAIWRSVVTIQQW